MAVLVAAGLEDAPGIVAADGLILVEPRRDGRQPEQPHRHADDDGQRDPQPRHREMPDQPPLQRHPARWHTGHAWNGTRQDARRRHQRPVGQAVVSQRRRNRHGGRLSGRGGRNRPRHGRHRLRWLDDGFNPLPGHSRPGGRSASPIPRRGWLALIRQVRQVRRCGSRSGLAQTGVRCRVGGCRCVGDRRGRRRGDHGVIR